MWILFCSSGPFHSKLKLQQIASSCKCLSVCNYFFVCFSDESQEKEEVGEQNYKQLQKLKGVQREEHLTVCFKNIQSK